MKKSRDKMTGELLVRLATQLTNTAFSTNSPFATDAVGSDLKVTALDQANFREIFSLLELVRRDDELWQIACDRLRGGLYLDETEEELSDQPAPTPIRPHLAA